MSPDLCYAAARSRDARFDGRFFTAVITTGIYCRPICPARTPRPENVRYYLTAAAAEEAWFRPCKRCRPETSPGTPAWSGTSTTVARALRIIDETSSIDDLATRLGITDRHLRRLFDEHVGASPMAILQTRRLHLARTLLRDTALPMGDVAFGAGFESVRRFNDAVRKVYRCTPSELRGKNDAGATIAIRLAYRAPFRFDAIARFLTDRDQMPKGIAHDDKGLRMVVAASEARNVHELVARARRTFDLAADPVAIDEHLRKDKRLRPLLLEHPGPRVPGAWNPMDVAIRGVVGQQVSVKGATTIMRRYQQSGVLGGMPKSRIDTVNAIREHPELLVRGASLDESIERLTGLKGIGLWTAHYIAMRVLGEPDAFPHSDLGLRKAATAIGIDSAKLLDHAERWRPWRAYAAIALWESL